MLNLVNLEISLTFLESSKILFKCSNFDLGAVVLSSRALRLRDKAFSTVFKQLDDHQNNTKKLSYPHQPS